MQKTSKRVLAIVLALIMALSVFSVAASAYSPGTANTHTVFRHTEQTLAPGVEYYKNYAYATDGEQNVYFVTTADISRDDVIVQTSYMAQYRNQTLGMSKLTDQVASANEYYSDPTSPQFISEYYNVVSACNASFYNMTTGQPTGVCYIDGVDFGTNAYPAFFAILTDGTAVIDDRANKGNYDIWQAVGGSQWLVRNGQDITASASGSYNTERHCRTAVGITAEGKVVIMSLDGRQSPYSIGGSMHEIAQIMLEADCVAAINLDGGGSTTFMAKEEGEDQAVIVDLPSDGSERAISAGLIIASTAVPSDVFHHAILTPDDEYISANASTTINAKGISPAGTAADIPAEAYFTTDNGTISADGILTPAAVGDATVQLVYNNEVVGETVVHVVVPDSIEFSVATLAAPYGKDADITMIAKYGEFNFIVKCDVTDYAFALDDAKYGTVEGFVFHATNDTDVTGFGTITATFVGSDKTATIPLTVGKGSEVLFDFEADVDNHQTSRWSGFDGYNAGIVTTCTPVTAENGKVHSGDYAMAYDMDFSQLTYYEDYTYSLMCYNWDDIAAHGFTYDADGVRQRGAEEDFVDITGATGLGMWMYIPDEVDVRGLDVRYTIGGKKTPTSNYERVNSAMGIFFPYRDGLGTDGWYYYYFDLSSYSSWACLRLQNTRLSNSISKNGKTSELYGDVMQLYVNDRAWKDADKQFKSYTSHVTLYIDDITVDYSSVVPDREAPVFTNPTYAFQGASDAMALNNGASIANNELEFAVAVAENTAKTNATGLNVASIKAYVDGVEVDSSYKNGKIAIAETTFADGAHTVTFEAADNTGNTSHITRKFTVNAGTDLDTIKIVPRYADMTETPVGSLYWIDIVATDVFNVENVSVTLKVNNVNDWEPQGIWTDSSFSASYEISNFDKGLITLNLTRIGETIILKNTAKRSIGDFTIASIPVRTWYPHNALGKDSNWIITQKKCVYPMDTQVFTKAGSVTFADGTASTFGAADIQCDSEAMCEYGYIGVNKGNEGGTNVVTSWHEHNAQPVDDLAPTCTEDGYSGRTYCEECHSVVDWGTVRPATGHDYQKDVCCEYLIISGNGSQTVNIPYEGSKGYYITGKEGNNFTVGSFDVEGENTIVFSRNWGEFGSDKIYIYYYDKKFENAAWPGEEMTYIGQNELDEAQFSFTLPEYLICQECGELYTGEYEGKTYVDGLVLEGFYDYKYYIDGVALDYDGPTLIGDLYYNFNNGTVLGLYTGTLTVDGLDYAVVDGVISENPLNGFKDGKYYVDGELQAYTGIVAVDNVYYEFDENYTTEGVFTGMFQIDGANYYSKLGVLSSGWYNIDGDWYLFDEETLAGVNGFWKNSNKVKFEFVNGKLLSGVWEKTIGKYRYWYGPTYYHLTSRNVNYLEQEVDGSLYLFDQGGYRATGIVNNHESNSKTLNWFNCGEDGKATKLQGPMILDYNGKLYYVDENGDSPAGKGLVKVGEDYYFVVYDGSVKVNGDRVVPADLTNDLLPAGTYNFDAEGKMTNAPLMNGVDENGYYRENGFIVKSAYLVKVDDDYYFVLYTGKVLKNADRTLSAENSNNLLPNGTYHFGADGKMTTVLNGVDPDDNYYRIDGAVQKAAYLVEDGGDYYFVTATGKILKDSDRYLNAELANNYVSVGTYHFGADGKMTTPLNGVDELGYYREDGFIVKSAYLVEVDGDYYFVLYNGKVLKNAERTLSAENSNNLLPNGTYRFGENGKMTTVLDGVDPVDHYYRVNGIVQKAAYLVKVDDDYYFVTATGKVLRDADRFLSNATANSLVPAGTYHFDAEGKMVNPPAAD